MRSTASVGLPPPPLSSSQGPGSSLLPGPRPLWLCFILLVSQGRVQPLTLAPGKGTALPPRGTCVSSARRVWVVL